MLKLGIFNKIVWIVNILVAISTLLCYTAPLINPGNFWPIAFLGLVYPLLLLINVVFILFWLIQKKFHFIFSLIILIFGWQHIQQTIQLPVFIKTKKIQASNNDTSLIKIMSYNVKNFDYYNWEHYNNIKSRKQFFKLIEKENPDIICFQEFFTLYEAPFQNLDTLISSLNYKWYYFEKKIILKNQYFGIATFSKFPIIKRGNIPFSNSKNNGCIYIDIKMNNDTVRVYNTHLQSIHFNEKDYEYIQEGEMHIEESKTLLSKVKKSYIKRSYQSTIVARHIRSSKHPVIVSGDFNDTPVSFTYNTIFKAKNLRDAFIEKGHGMGKTYAGPIPCLRIDYVFLDKLFEVHDYQTINKNYSDHFPVICSFSFKSNE